jgi:hypothetical protein
MRKLESYIRKYGEKDGRAMYERLQREAALASAHARHKKAIKNPAAVELGRAGGTARGKSLSKEELSAIGKAGAAKRWGKKSTKGGK